MQPHSYSTQHSVIGSHQLHKWLTDIDHASPASSNQPSIALPFQRWFKFKEAFSPALVIDCLQRAGTKATTCIDPFGGCGTTGLTCQFAGIHPTLIEVNPFIADLAQAKLTTYDIDALQTDYLRIRKAVREARPPDLHQHFGDAPATLYEPGQNDRWVFPASVLQRILSYRAAINTLEHTNNARLLRVILGSLLVPCSNVVVNGKGRKYRTNWKVRQKKPEDVDQLFESTFMMAVGDLQLFQRRPWSEFTLLRGSCLDRIDDAEQADIAIFSPPYPNSFDYTDIYNLELWVLGYLQSRQDNSLLRSETLRSHVQVELPKRGSMVLSPTLQDILDQLNRGKATLWNTRIPNMVDGYFSDLQLLLEKLQGKLRTGGSAFIIVGDSQYNGIRVPVADILAEIAASIGYQIAELERLRTMRVSAQQGGEFDLQECRIQITR